MWNKKLQEIKKMNAIFGEEINDGATDFQHTDISRVVFEGYVDDDEIMMCDNIWIGFFNTILEGGFSSEFQKNGIIECYFNQDGFYDEKWEMKYPHIVLEELKRFNEKLLDTRNEEIIKKSKEVVEQLVSFINMAVRNEKNGSITKLMGFRIPHIINSAHINEF